MTERKKLYFSIGILFFIFLAVFGIYVYYFEKIIPNIYLASTNVGNLTISQARNVLQSVNPPKEIVLSHSGEENSITTASFDLSYDFEKTTKSAFLVGRSGNLWLDTKDVFTAHTRGKKIGFVLNLDEEKLKNIFLTTAGDLDVEPIPPSAKLVDNKIVIDSGKEGATVNFTKARVDLGQILAYSQGTPLKIESQTVDPRLTMAESLLFRLRSEKVKDKIVKITFEDESFTFKGNDILKFINPYATGEKTTDAYDQNKILESIAPIVEKTERDPTNPTFTFEEGRVKEFAPAKDGVKVEVEKTTAEIVNALQTLEGADQKEVSFSLPHLRAKPEVETSEVNHLGINELIGKGTSVFRGSIPGRIYNVAHASSKINGILVAPGETFSFNKALGDVSKLTGYKEAYIIKDGKTILGDGGGVCQVSTTLFRAILNAGLPIQERQAHAYRVGYYEQDSGPGLDATVYDPSPDLKFKNDTPAHILIQAKADTKNMILTFELYGTKDGRVSTVTKPKILSSTAPPADSYVDDPTLPIGTTKQIEHKAWGAKVVFDYLVTRNGEEIYKKTFISNYRPWGAVYMRGTGPTQ